MAITARKLSTNDVLIFDGNNYESYVIKPNKVCKTNDDLLIMAKDLVAKGQGIHLNRSHLNQLHQATKHMEMLT